MNSAQLSAHSPQVNGQHSTSLSFERTDSRRIWQVHLDVFALIV
jgi:hypothetical protein